MADRVIEVDVSQQTIALRGFADCPLRDMEDNSCNETLGECVTGTYGRGYTLNPLCPLLAGAVIVRRKA